MVNRPFVAAIDVGTGSARAAIVDARGEIRAYAVRDIAVNRPRPRHMEHSSEDIWAAVCGAMRAALADAALSPEQIVGLSFDATSCTLVWRDRDMRPISISADGDARWDTIVWADHRAIAEAEECSATGHPALRHVGGVMSPEMQIPKSMWVKRHLPDTWARTGNVFDLTDYLTWRATGSDARSTCTVTCKWTYLAHEKDGWPSTLHQAVGLDDMMDHIPVPERAVAVATPIGRLTEAAAADLGLGTDCIVAAGLIDAHAGMLGVLGDAIGAADGAPIDNRIGLIAGTSTCHMALSPEPRFIDGVWGPYFGAIVPGMWVNEGGQGASGSLLDHILELHGRTPDAATHAEVVATVERLRAAHGPGLDPELMVLPDFHGNRSPLADPNARGVISGLTMETGDDALARVYFATALGVVLGTRHIIDAMNDTGYRIRHLHLTGGHRHNPLLLSLYADATGCTVALPEQEEGVLIGTAMLAATAAGLHPDLGAAGAAMARTGRTVAPDPAVRPLYDRRYQAFLKMHEHRRELAALVAE